MARQPKDEEKKVAIDKKSEALHIIDSICN